MWYKPAPAISFPLLESYSVNNRPRITDSRWSRQEVAQIKKNICFGEGVVFMAYRVLMVLADTMTRRKRIEVWSAKWRKKRNRRRGIKNKDQRKAGKSRERTNNNNNEYINKVGQKRKILGRKKNSGKCNWTNILCLCLKRTGKTISWGLRIYWNLEFIYLIFRNAIFYLTEDNYALFCELRNP